VLENPEYETLRRALRFAAKNNELIFDLIKKNDREWLKKKADPFYVLLDSLAKALEELDWTQALVFQNRVAEYTDPPPYNADSLARVIQVVKMKVLDSLMARARAAEDSQKLADAYYYYRRVVEYDSTNELARQKVAELFVPKPETTRTKASVLSEVDIEALYQQGVSKFIVAEYEEAEKIFKKVLAQNPAHEKAKEYLHRTQARIKALKQ
jgi:tetratricopeptide (TPR) repeat protein